MAIDKAALQKAAADHLKEMTGVYEFLGDGDLTTLQKDLREAAKAYPDKSAESNTLLLLATACKTGEYEFANAYSLLVRAAAGQELEPSQISQLERESSDIIPRSIKEFLSAKKSDALDGSRPLAFKDPNPQEVFKERLLGFAIAAQKIHDDRTKEGGIDHGVLGMQKPEADAPEPDVILRGKRLAEIASAKAALPGKIVGLTHCKAALDIMLEEALLTDVAGNPTVDAAKKRTAEIMRSKAFGVLPDTISMNKDTIKSLATLITLFEKVDPNTIPVESRGIDIVSMGLLGLIESKEASKLFGLPDEQVKSTRQKIREHFRLTYPNGWKAIKDKSGLDDIEFAAGKEIKILSEAKADPAADAKEKTAPAASKTEAKKADDKKEENKDKAGTASRVIAGVAAGAAGILGVKSIFGKSEPAEGAAEEKPSGGFFKVVTGVVMGALVAVGISHAVTGGKWQATVGKESIGKWASYVSNFAGWTKGGQGKA